MKQKQEERVDRFYDKIRDVLRRCEYDDVIEKVTEEEALKYGLTETKILENVYALPKTTTTGDILRASWAE